MRDEATGEEGDIIYEEFTLVRVLLFGVCFVVMFV